MAEATAWIFPGQGSQYVGMGQDLCEAYAVARDTFAEASGILGMDLARLCADGPEDVLADTIYAQPAVLTMSVALCRLLQERGARLPSCVAGHSLGEYSALVAAGALDFADALYLVRRRGELMQRAGLERPGGMAALLGLDPEAIGEICTQAQAATGGTVVAANYNSPGQTVISGDQISLQRAMSLALEKGAQRIVPLAVSIAGHSPLMAPAAEAFSPLLGSAPLRRAAVPVIANVSAQALEAPEEIRCELLAQITGPVRWVDSVVCMADRGVRTFVEVGPGRVLTGLIRRMDRDLKGIAIGNAQQIQSMHDLGET